MSVRRFGDGDGARHVVYLHGLGEASGVFAPLLREPALSDGSFTHTLPDLPGYGRSVWPDKPMPLDDLAHELADWMAGFRTPPVLVGHSMGGVMAVLVAEAAPAVVTAVVNIEGNVSLDDCTFSGRVAAYDEARYIAEGHAQMANHIRSMATDGSPESYYAAAFQFADPASTYRHATDLVEVSVTETMAARMAAQSVPCVFIAGVPRGLAPRSVELLTAAGVPTVRVELAGHRTYWDQPRACAAVVAELAGA